MQITLSDGTIVEHENFGWYSSLIKSMYELPDDFTTWDTKIFTVQPFVGFITPFTTKNPMIGFFANSTVGIPNIDEYALLAKKKAELLGLSCIIISELGFPLIGRKTPESTWFVIDESLLKPFIFDGSVGGYVRNLKTSKNLLVIGDSIRAVTEHTVDSLTFFLLPAYLDCYYARGAFTPSVISLYYTHLHLSKTVGAEFFLSFSSFERIYDTHKGIFPTYNPNYTGNIHQYKTDKFEKFLNKNTLDKVPVDIYNIFAKQENLSVLSLAEFLESMIYPELFIFDVDTDIIMYTRKQKEVTLSKDSIVFAGVNGHSLYIILRKPFPSGFDKQHLEGLLASAFFGYFNILLTVVER